MKALIKSTYRDIIKNKEHGAKRSAILIRKADPDKFKYTQR